MKAVYIEQHGGIEVLHYGDRPKPEPAPGEVLVKVVAAGVNYIDTYHRTGIYKLSLPAIIGSEAAGVVEKVGPEVSGFKPGDRVAYAMARGSYAEYHSVPANVLVHVPAGVEMRDAAAVMLQGMTAHYLAHSTFPIKPGHTALVHAAAGGAGGLLVQIASMLGARVIATVGSPAKAELAKQAGATDVILYNEQDFAAEVKRITGGAGVDVIYDSVGKTTFLKGFECLKARGMMVSYGQASGVVPSIEPLMLSKGSWFLTRPTLAHHVGPELPWRSGDLFRWMAEGKLKLRTEHVYTLADAAQAHRDLEGRKTTGKLILMV